MILICNKKTNTYVSLEIDNNYKFLELKGLLKLATNDLEVIDTAFKSTNELDALFARYFPQVVSCW